MKSSTKNAVWLVALITLLITLMTASLATVHAQNQDKAQAKPAGEGGAMKGGMPQMGQGGMT
jgi:hypothetical protein